MDIKKTGLVLEGGAMRGMFTCGVLDVLLENDIKFDGAIGVSAGASFGCHYGRFVIIVDMPMIQDIVVLYLSYQQEIFIMQIFVIIRFLMN